MGTLAEQQLLFERIAERIASLDRKIDSVTRRLNAQTVQLAELSNEIKRSDSVSVGPPTRRPK